MINLLLNLGPPEETYFTLGCITKDITDTLAVDCCLVKTGTWACLGLLVNTKADTYMLQVGVFGLELEVQLYRAY